MISLLGLLAGGLVAGAAGRPPENFKQQIEPLLQSYCFDCHGDGMAKGGLALDAYKTNSAQLHNRDTWLAVWRKLDSGLMPPAKKSQPTPDERRRLQEWIKWQAFSLDPEHPDPGRVTLRRLNRVEYENTIHDLLGVDYATAENFPPDDTGYGFDTVGDVLSLSPLLMEKYFAAAQDISAELLKKTAPQIPVFGIGGDKFRATNDDPRNARAMPLAQAATAEHVRSLTHPGRYRISAEFQVTGSEEATTETASLRLRINDREFDQQSLGWDYRRKIKLTAETDLAAGTNVFALQLVPGNPPLPGENHLVLNVDQVRVQGPLSGPKTIYPPEHRRWFPDGEPPAAAAARTDYARKVLRALADRVFRRPVEATTLDRLVAIALASDQKSGGEFRAGIGDALTAMLASPRFLFRAEFQPEPDNPARIMPVDEFALASRLSYFLWSSLPDDELFALARTNGLRPQLATQVNRMLADPRANRFVENFVGQWLQTRDVEAVAVDAKQVLELRTYEEAGKLFDDNLRRAMRQETELFVADVLRNNGTLAELLTSRQAFLNEPLARFYGVPGVAGSQLRKVTLPEDSPRGGLLTQGSFLLVTSNPTRTSPVKRGQFILENLLGTPAPPPPPDIPDLEASRPKDKASVTMRELMAIHREQPLCSSCHERMDPLGLAFEHFNALGKFRGDDHGQPILTAGNFVTGEAFATPADLATVLTTTRRRDYYRCVTEKLLTYALGRGMEYYDVPTIDRIVAELESDHGRIRTLVQAVVKSAPFQMRRGTDKSPLPKIKSAAL